MKDANGDELTYWPITGLVEGETSQVLTILVTTPVVGGYLRASNDPRLKVWARPKDVGEDYVDIRFTGIALADMPVGDTEFEIYVEAVTPITGLERIPVAVSASGASAANWLA